MIETTTKISLELDAIRSRVEELGEDFRTEWEEVEHDPVQSDLFQAAQYEAEDAAQLIEKALSHLERIFKNRKMRDLYE